MLPYVQDRVNSVRGIETATLLNLQLSVFSSIIISQFLINKYEIKIPFMLVHKGLGIFNIVNVKRTLSKTTIGLPSNLLSMKYVLMTKTQKRHFQGTRSKWCNKLTARFSATRRPKHTAD